ncbi:thiol-disulfide oxidoreductase ResA [Bacillus sp. 2205SS5-2]|uniref:thiol-disulfide oxidoreductase ResA n=1 Tax=Bacillus sp. 2205SS5-2 TaxID=3109031 RepID=UPI003006863B
MQKKQKRLLMRSIILAILLAAVGYTLYASITKDSRDMIKIGKPAPNFMLTDLEGNSHTLSDYKGQGVMVNFWGTYCKPCEKEMPAMDRQYQVFQDQGIEILAVNVGESKYLVEKFAKKYDLSFPVVTDVEGDVQDAYGVYNLPVTFLVNPDGNIESILKGELTDEIIANSFEKLKP